TVINIFFFQAEDGIRDKLVTGVQTCALPIFDYKRTRLPYPYVPVIPDKVSECACNQVARGLPHIVIRDERMGIREAHKDPDVLRSEERRVGKEGRCRGWS